MAVAIAVAISMGMSRSNPHGSGAHHRCQAWEIDDRAKTGPLVLARDRLRTVRQGVVDRGWHRGRIFGGPLRWLGDKLP